MTDQNLLQEIENVYFRYYRKRRDQLAQTAPNAEQESNYRWHALDALLENAPPDSYHAVDFDGGLAIVVVIGDAVHVLTTSDTQAVTLTVGPLGGGVYEEKIAGGDDGEVVGTFTHPQLPSPLSVQAGRWDQDKAARDVRTLFRDWASQGRPT